MLLRECYEPIVSGAEDFKYHENEGLVGWILLTARLSLFAWFRSGSLAGERSGAEAVPPHRDSASECLPWKASSD